MCLLGDGVGVSEPPGGGDIVCKQKEEWHTLENRK
jgi:hypothetical protein